MALRIASWLVIAYLAYCCILFLTQRRIMFPRHVVGSPPKPKIDLPGLEEMWLGTSQGKVEAWFIPAFYPEGEPAPAVIFAHGNAELIDFWPLEFKHFSSLGIGLLLVEYPGYGRSKGTPSQKSITETFVAAYDMLVARKDVDPARVLLFGRSMGGGAACALAAERPSAGLILMSTFTNVQSFAGKFLVPPFLVQDRFDNLSVVRDYSGPVLIMHGRHDALIPYAHGVALHGAAEHGKMITYDCDHNDCPPSWNTFWDDMEAWLSDTGVVENGEAERGE